MDKPKQPLKWVPWYDVILKLHLKGMTNYDISHKLEKHVNTIQKVTKSQEFRDKIKALSKTRTGEGFNARIRLNQYKERLLNEQIKIATESDNEKIRASVGQWLLEQFPELAPKNVPHVTQNTNVYKHSNEDTDRQEKTADKLSKVADILNRGYNPNVIVPNGEGGFNTEEDEQDNRPQTDTNEPGGDTQAQG